ncbi:hypothetical protein HGRIS_000578 [Hohenbuehelia grisea]|uniref:Uncharacterized protein n=1 Tax=Hohenbuehelia grisea TaxID=104357 RepID=A0ABR3JTC9_9AGAR
MARRAEWHRQPSTISKHTEKCHPDHPRICKRSHHGSTGRVATERQAPKHRSAPYVVPQRISAPSTQHPDINGRNMRECGDFEEPVLHHTAPLPDIDPVNPPQWAGAVPQMHPDQWASSSSNAAAYLRPGRWPTISAAAAYLHPDHMYSSIASGMLASSFGAFNTSTMMPFSSAPLGSAPDHLHPYGPSGSHQAAFTEYDPTLEAFNNSIVDQDLLNNLAHLQLYYVFTYDNGGFPEFPDFPGFPGFEYDF